MSGEPQLTAEARVHAVLFDYTHPAHGIMSLVLPEHAIEVAEAHAAAAVAEVAAQKDGAYAELRVWAFEQASGRAPEVGR